MSSSPVFMSTSEPTPTHVTEQKATVDPEGGDGGDGGSDVPSSSPTNEPTVIVPVSNEPTRDPISVSTESPTSIGTSRPTNNPLATDLGNSTTTAMPTTAMPSTSDDETLSPSEIPSYEPSAVPTMQIVQPTPDGTARPSTALPTMDRDDTEDPAAAVTAEPTTSTIPPPTIDHFTPSPTRRVTGTPGTWSPSRSPTMITTDINTMDPTPVPTKRVTMTPTHDDVMTPEPTPRVWWHTTTTTISTDAPCIPGWNEWGPWSACSNQCGMGMKYRMRSCNKCDDSSSSSSSSSSSPVRAHHRHHLHLRRVPVLRVPL